MDGTTEGQKCVPQYRHRTSLTATGAAAGSGWVGCTHSPSAFKPGDGGI